MLNKNRTLKCETLESRELMAGNVQVNVVNNEVKIYGDSKANQIEVFQLDNGAYRVVGYNGTTVNGKASVDAFSRDRDLRIYMGAGDDTVILGNNPVRRAMMMEDLEIDMGLGNDGLGIINVQTTDNQFATIRMGGSESETDLLAIQQATFKTGLSFDMGGGNDKVEITKTTVNGKLDGRLGSGNDSLKLVDVYFSTSYLDGGTGTDTYSRTRGKAATIVNF